MTSSPGGTADSLSNINLSMLLIGALPLSTANTIKDHIFAFVRFSRNRIHFLQNAHAIYHTPGAALSTFPKRLRLENYDVLIIHYSCYLPGDSHFDAQTREKISSFTGLKVLFIQDEYRHVNEIHARIRELGIHVLFSCVPESEMEKVYPESALPNLTKVSTLTGFVPANLLRHRVPPISRRPIHVGYRARKLPFWLGELAVEKWSIVPQFLSATAGRGLALDISYNEADRIYGKAWLKFVTSCKSTLGVESGASVFDFTGEIRQSVDAHMQNHPDATFEEVQRLYLAPYEGKIRLNQISPRCFEAAALKTAMVLFEGEYSNILIPWRHYIPLKKDFSNIDEVVAKLSDDDALQALVDRTHAEIALNPRYSYAEFVAGFDRIVTGEMAARRFLKPRNFSERTSSVTAPTAFIRSQTTAANVTMAQWLVGLRNVTIHLRFRLSQTILGAAYRCYVRLIPATVRDRIRPMVRRILFR